MICRSWVQVPSALRFSSNRRSPPVDVMEQLRSLVKARDNLGGVLRPHRTTRPAILKELNLWQAWRTCDTWDGSGELA